MCGICLLIDCGVVPNLHGDMSHNTYSKGMKYMKIACCGGKVNNVGNI